MLIPESILNNRKRDFWVLFSITAHEDCTLHTLARSMKIYCLPLSARLCLHTEYTHLTSFPQGSMSLWGSWHLLHRYGNGRIEKVLAAALPCSRGSSKESTARILSQRLPPPYQKKHLGHWFQNYRSRRSSPESLSPWV